MIALTEQCIDKLMSLKLKKTVNPEELGDSIAALESEYRSPIQENQKVKIAGWYYSDVI